MAVLTPFGQVLRKLRIEKNVTLHELSERLGNSPAFISAVETGRKPIPDAFVLHVSKALELSTSQISDLRKAADRTRKEVRVEKLSGEQRELIAAFARTVDDIPPDRLEKIKKLIMESIEGDVPFKRSRRGLVVPPLSNAAIRGFTEKVRSVFVASERRDFPIIEVLEFQIPNLLNGFYFDVRDKNAMGALEGMVIAGKAGIAIREDVYVAACRGEGRARFTCCHEFGHFLLHSSVTMARVREESDQVYCDSEWQADAFAGSLMMSPKHVAEFKDAEAAASDCGMSQMAARVMWDKYKKAGLR